MKILEMISSLNHRGGAEVFAVNLAINFKKSGHDVILVSIHDNPHDSFVETCKFNGIKLFFLHKHRKIDFKSSKLFKKIAISYQPDIIHMHISCLATYFLSFGLRNYKWVLFETMHSIPGSTLNSFNKKLRQLYLKRKKLNLVSISESMNKIASEKYGKTNLYNINNGCSITRPIKIKSYNERTYDFTIIASFTDVKNHMFLFNAIEDLTKSYPNLMLACVGSGPLQETYSKFITDKKMTNNIKFLGQLDSVEDILNNSKSLVLVSKREGNPICVLEGISMGVPVVCPNIGGIPDIVKDGDNGYLFKSRDENDLKDKLLKVLNEKKWNQISEKNLSLIDDYSMEFCCSKYSKLFLEVKKIYDKNVKKI